MQSTPCCILISYFKQKCRAAPQGSNGSLFLRRNCPQAPALDKKKKYPAEGSHLGQKWPGFTAPSLAEYHPENSAPSAQKLRQNLKGRTARGWNTHLVTGQACSSLVEQSELQAIINEYTKTSFLLPQNNSPSANI